MKSEPSEFSIDDLGSRPGKIEPWDGVRNYQARNMLRDDMRPGDLAFFYHSNCAQPGVAGIMEIVSSGYPDKTAFNPEDKHFDPKSNPDKPRWYLVDVKFKRKLRRAISLQELRGHKKLDALKLLQKGSRLSIMPVSQQHWNYILSLE